MRKTRVLLLKSLPNLSPVQELTNLSLCQETKKLRGNFSLFSSESVNTSRKLKPCNLRGSQVLFTSPQQKNSWFFRKFLFTFFNCDCRISLSNSRTWFLRSNLWSLIVKKTSSVSRGIGRILVWKTNFANWLSVSVPLHYCFAKLGGYPK